jgi:3-oxoacyl-[acyl-carrier protein] reductase
MNLELNGKVAIVGGGSQGIGLGIATALAAEGARVVISARREADLVAAVERIKAETGGEVSYVAADCREAADCRKVVAAAVERHGGLDILVNNDGAPPVGPVLGFDDIAWQKAVEQNLMYPIRMAREAVPHMRQRGGGSILNITAISAIQPIRELGLSVTTWSGVIGFAKTLSLELGEFGINVNTICPGYIDTSRLRKVFASGNESSESVQDRLALEVPVRRIGTPEDIASLVALLVSPKGTYITGTAIQVDGGLLRGVR